MRFWSGRVPAEKDVESQQEKLRRMSGNVLARYQKELAAEISDPARLQAVYGTAFTTAESKRQAEVVARMAASMVKTPYAAVNVLNDDTQESVAQIENDQLRKESAKLPAQEGFCRNVIHTGREMLVENALEHPLVCDTKAAIDGYAVAYLGVPVANRAGIIIGSLCVWDEAPREWTQADVSLLAQLSMVLTRSLS